MSRLKRIVKIIYILFLIVSIQSGNVVLANDLISLNLSPGDIYRGSTTTIFLEINSNYNISDIKIQLYVDGNKVGAKGASEIVNDKTYLLTFDYFSPEDSYLGEHYIELELDYFMDGIPNSKIFYKTINVSDKGNHYGLIYLFLLIIMVVVIIINRHFDKKNIINFEGDGRRTIFGLIITILPISSSFFALSIDKTQLLIGIIPILISFVISYGLAIYAFIRYELASKRPVKANNYIFYSILFLFIGLINMVFLIVLRL